MPNPGERLTRFTKDEQRLLVSLWALTSSPRMLGMNLPDNDPKTLALLTNDQVLAVDQDRWESRRSGSSVISGPEGNLGPEVGGWLAGGRLFNRGDASVDMIFRFDEAGLSGRWQARDLWRQKDLGQFTGSFSSNVNPHGVTLIKVSPVSKPDP